MPPCTNLISAICLLNVLLCTSSRTISQKSKSLPHDSVVDKKIRQSVESAIDIIYQCIGIAAAVSVRKTITSVNTLCYKAPRQVTQTRV